MTALECDVLVDIEMTELTYDVLVDVPLDDYLPARLAPSPGFHHSYNTGRFLRAISARDVEAVERIIEWDVDDINECCSDMTPLSVALDRGHKEITALLITHGADYRLLDEEAREKFFPILLEVFHRGPQEYLSQKRREREKEEEKILLEIKRNGSWSLGYW